MKWETSRYFSVSSVWCGCGQFKKTDFPSFSNYEKFRASQKNFTCYSCFSSALEWTAVKLYTFVYCQWRVKGGRVSDNWSSAHVFVYQQAYLCPAARVMFSHSTMTFMVDNIISLFYFHSTADMLCCEAEISRHLNSSVYRPIASLNPI